MSQVVVPAAESHLPPLKKSLQAAYHHAGGVLRHHKLAAGAVLILIIGAATTQLGAHVWSAKNIAPAPAAIKVSARPISGFNRTVPAAQLNTQLQTIASQPVTLTVGQQTVNVSSDTIKTWLQVTSNKNKSEYYLHVNEAAIAASLEKLAGRYVKAPVNQVTVNEDGINQVVVGGRDGTALSDPNSLKTQAQQVAKTVMDSKGMQFNTPLAAVPFQAVTAANFDKLIVSDINTKKLWAFQNGQLIRTIPISAGARATPTPIGQFKIYAKFTVQDMRGTNPNGTPYFQPKVPWVSYFTAGNAIHGVYWHGDDWFGNINSSHGCLGAKVSEAKWVFDWAPIGTTVIVHT